MSFIKKIFYLFIFIIIIIISFIIIYYYIKNYILDIVLNYNENIQKLQGFDKLKNEQYLLRKFVYGTPDFNKRFLINNLINKKEINILKNIFKLYSKNIVANINKQININLIDNYGIIPKENDIIFVEQIIHKIKRKTELLYNIPLKTTFYILCANKKGSIVYPHSDCKSFDKEKNKFIDNICPDRHFSVSIPLNNNYKGGNFKFCNDNKIINIKKGQSLIFDGNEIHEVSEISHNKRLVLLIWFTRI